MSHIKAFFGGKAGITHMKWGLLIGFLIVIADELLGLPIFWLVVVSPPDKMAAVFSWILVAIILLKVYILYAFLLYFAIKKADSVLSTLEPYEFSVFVLAGFFVTENILLSYSAKQLTFEGPGLIIFILTFAIPAYYKKSKK